MKRPLLLLLILLVLTLTQCSGTDWLTSDILTEHTPDSTAINPDSRYIVVVGDIQSYTVDPSKMPYFKASMDWLAMQQSFFGNIDAVIQVGDITNDNTEAEWNRAVIAMRPVATMIPTIAVPGNHDYDWLRGEGDDFKLITSRESSGFDSHPLPIARGMAIVDRFDSTSRHNAVYSLTIAGRRTHIVALEFAPRREVVEWAGRHIAANPSTDCYLLTHEWLTPKGELAERGGWCDGPSQFAQDSTVMTPGEVFRQIVEPYDNLIAVICGHHQFVKYLETPNAAGRPVPQILFNLQYQENGGNGMLQLWELPAGSDSVYTRVYNTISRLHHPVSITHVNFSRARAATDKH